MARDYKNSGRSGDKKKAGKSGWPGPLWMLLGMVVGVAAGLLIGLGVYSVRVVKDLQLEIRQIVASRPGMDPDKVREAVAMLEAQRKVEPPTPRPRFEYPEMLPRMEVEVGQEPAPPEARPTPPRTDRPEPPRQAPAATERVLVQVASYARHEDADRLKAQLAFMGLQANIQRVELKPGQVVHRVRLGPYGDKSEAEKVRQRLKAEGLNSMVVPSRG